jgi:hypothetical protein
VDKKPDAKQPATHEIPKLQRDPTIQTKNDSKEAKLNETSNNDDSWDSNYSLVKIPKVKLPLNKEIYKGSRAIPQVELLPNDIFDYDEHCQVSSPQVVNLKYENIKSFPKEQSFIFC